MQRGRFSSSAEYVIYASNGVPFEGEKSPQNVIPCPPVQGKDKDHIAEKPLDLMRQIISITAPGALIVDPFMGSGTTGAACVTMDRRFVGIEIDKRSFDIACAKIEEAQRQLNLGL
jgi:site-specific DNA-methyltransferase (adenine-specific)